MKQHTPAPWAILERAEDSRTHVSNGAHIVCTLGTTRTDGSPNHSANAALIASAPEMLQALESCLDYLLMDSMIEEDAAPEIESIRKAISKAKGEA